MNIDQETSVGAVIYKTENGTNLFLLVYSGRNKEWGFPKGHSEGNETEMQTAEREILEEAGIADLKFIDGFRKTDSYEIKGTLAHTKDRIITKNVIYYLASVKSGFVCPKDGEIRECGWFSYREAVGRLGHEKQKKILKEANSFLGGKIK